MYCSECQTQNPVSSHYCEACGNILDPVERTESVNRPSHFNERHPSWEKNWSDL